MFSFSLLPSCVCTDLLIIFLCQFSSMYHFVSFLPYQSCRLRVQIVCFAQNTVLSFRVLGVPFLYFLTLTVVYRLVIRTTNTLKNDGSKYVCPGINSHTHQNF
uniref:Uncharacterized protein n=1 Tax=Cacopsylla melanoneura TaxID=428564 RepID=A0A8D8ZD79_9HEMI